MNVVAKKITLKTKGNGHIIDITADVVENLSDTKIADGIVAIFAIGSTAALTTVEYEPGLIKDLQDLFERIAPSDKPYAHDAAWGDANGHSHIRASVIGPSLTIPFTNGKLTLGVWQQIIFIDFDHKPRSREIILQFIGKQ